ncbi:MAG TPA: efflux RND transporter permease subunit [Verrucomicrobiae bacterium]|nr:efflux RND transporter permease subunit [Verrucomicrobiae bacterium]
MNISELFVRKPVMTTLVTAAVTAFGIAAYFSLPISDLPSVDYPVITINVAYPGASPQMMAATVASPLEAQCMQIPGLVSIISDNTEGQTKITLTFDLDRSSDLAAPDVQAAISRAAGNLPPDLPQPPTYNKFNPSEKPILYYMVGSDTLTAGELYDCANRTIGQRLTMIEGVSQVQVYGAKASIRVQINPRRLASYKLGLDDVARSISAGTVTIPAGSLDGPFRTFSIEPNGQLLRASDCQKLIVAYRNGAPVRLEDLGQCVDSVENDVMDKTFVRSGERVQHGIICLAVSRQAGANTVALAKKLNETIGQLKASLPGSVRVETFYDRSVQIIESIDDVKATIVIALVLVVLVIFLFLGRASDTIIPSITMPLSLVGTFVVMKVLHFSLDNLSLMGLTLCIGFLVDDAIVELENTVRHLDKGADPFNAAIVSAIEISGTVISTSVALMIMFVPLVFMGGVVGRSFHEFALTVISAIFCSLVLARTLTPMMLSRMLKPVGENKSAFQRAVDSVVGGMVRSYGGVLTWFLRHKFVPVLIWAACIAGTLWMFKVLPKTFLPIGDSGMIMGQIVAHQGTSTEQIREFRDQVGRIIMANKNVGTMYCVAGSQAGADQSTAPIFITLKPRDQREPMRKVVGELNRALAGLPYRFVFVAPRPALSLSTGGESTATGCIYSYGISGSDRAQVFDCAQRLEAAMRGLPQLQDIQSSVKLDMPQLDVEIMRDRASALGLTAEDIERALSLAYSGGQVTLYKTDVDQYKIIVELEKTFQHDPRNLGTIYLRSQATGALVPMGSVAKWRESVGPQNVPHYDQLISATISFNVAPDVPLGDATAAIENAARGILPPEITGRFQGQAAEFQKSLSSLTVMLVVAIFLMYIVLGILYESYVHPFTVLTTLPVAAFGGLATLYLFNQQLSLYANIGIFMLLGIVAKNGIMMVDFANQHLAEAGCSDFDAIHHACMVRFRPILMTGVAAIMGAMPIALGYGADGASRMPLGLVVVGGLVFSQVVTLFVTPGIFLYMQRFQVFLNRFAFFRSDVPQARGTTGEENGT